MRTLYFVTPCGGTHGETQMTANSVIQLALLHPATRFVHLLVFNNGLAPSVDIETGPSNYEPRVSDLGDVGSRAAARNHGLDALVDEPAGLICFLDAGDLVVESAPVHLAFATWQEPHELRLMAFSAIIIGKDIRSIRRPRPLWLRRINNPFLIGATYAASPLALSTRFSEGAKEDWKYWLELIEHATSVSRHDEVAYEYQVVSTTDHLRRKKGLLRQQYRFFSDYLGYGHGLRTSASMVAHILIAGTAWIRRSTRLQLWRRSSSDDVGGADLG